jgi:hypothetical protein
MLTLSLTKVSKIAFGAPMTGITEEQRAHGLSLINPPKAQLVSVAEALASPKKKRSRLFKEDLFRYICFTYISAAIVLSNIFVIFIF